MIHRVLSLSIVVLVAFSAISVHGEDASSKIPPPLAAPASSGAAYAKPAGTAPKPEADLASRVAALEKQVADLEQFRKEQIDLTDNQSKMLRDIVTARPTAEGGQRYVPNVQAIRDDRTSRRELVETVVQGITSSTGELRIRNDMKTGQSLVINGVDTVYIAPHATRTVTVPSGTATTQLAGEGTRSWMIGAPTYAQDIIIAPGRAERRRRQRQWRLAVRPSHGRLVAHGAIKRPDGL